MDKDTSDKLAAMAAEIAALKTAFQELRNSLAAQLETHRRAMQADINKHAASMADHLALHVKEVRAMKAGEKV